MPRDGLGQYAPPAGTHGIVNYTVESARYNTFVDDITIDQNTPRPISSGGTGATLPDDVLDNISAEKFGQLVLDWDANVWRAGSFYATVAATGTGPLGIVPPAPAHAYAGTAYLANASDDWVNEVVDLTDPTHPVYIRIMSAGVWGPWGLEASSQFVLKAGDIMTGNLAISKANPVLSLNKQLAGEVNILGGAMGGVPRWTMLLGDTAPEAGANAGSDFVLNRHDDAGALLAQSLKIARDTGAVAVTGAATIAGAVNITGNTAVTGTLGVSGAVTCGQVNCGPVVSTGYSHFVDKVAVQSTGRPCFALWNTTINAALGCWIDVTQSTLLFGNLDGSLDPFAYWFGIGSGNGLFCGMAAYKPGGGPWADSSDARIKNVIGGYTSGLDAVAALNPTRFTFKGNDTSTAGGQSIHHDVAARSVEFIGLIAQEAELAMPELVTRNDAYIDGVAVSDLRMIDTTPLIYALINSIKELKARLEAVEAR